MAVAQGIGGAMSEMVKLVARAIHRVYGSGEPSELDMADAREEARAAIEAMREPTREMLDASYDAVDAVIDDGNRGQAASGAWQAMIDEALRDG